ncbi:hypothetical protein CCY99_06090 [Helicobacter sp. 16-1353]|uniref:hypothetical protein n=1 Tax=Helicobacter sp. 16-1353 TaxID=2004996 RepID=UPI000DCF45E4|nr:hypothetical protein [Helicobacter sp. 16-1353]RAX53160.1 hypothetical protein CCY99_06090 [Helicobacter sp. 16-1353]
MKLAENCVFKETSFSKKLRFVDLEKAIKSTLKISRVTLCRYVKMGRFALKDYQMAITMMYMH